MSIDHTSDSVLAATLRQLITAIQLMQTAVDGLNVVIESNTAMSNALTEALTAMGSTLSQAPVPVTFTPTASAGPATSTPTASAGPATSNAAAPAPSSVTTQPADLTSTANPALNLGEDTIPWYAVIVGRNPGVFYGSDGVHENADRIPGGKVVRYVTGRQDVIDGFLSFLNAGRVERVQLAITRTILHPGDSSIPGLL